MALGEIIVIVVGLVLFEIVSSVDNAVVNADVIGTLSPRWRRLFLLYGFITAVLLIRGLLPLFIVYFANPGLSLDAAFTATFSSSEEIKAVIEKQSPILLAGGGIFLIYLFFNWLFLETKNYAFFLERHIHKRYYLWFYTIASLILLFIVWATIKINSLISLGAVVGSTAFFIVSGFRKSVEEKEKELLREDREDNRKQIVRSRSNRLFSSRIYKLSFALISATLFFAAWEALKSGSTLALGITMGLIAAFSVIWFRRKFGGKRRQLADSSSSDLSKVLYLELIDASFSIDGVLGAFAFTRAVPLILIGNGIGALIVRYFTVRGVATVKRFAYLKNGAMYSIGLLGVVMLLESFGRQIAFWVSPLITFLIIGLFLYLSKLELEAREVI